MVKTRISAKDLLPKVAAAKDVYAYVKAMECYIKVDKDWLAKMLESDAENDKQYEVETDANDSGEILWLD